MKMLLLTGFITTSFLLLYLQRAGIRIPESCWQFGEKDPFRNMLCSGDGQLRMSGVFLIILLDAAIVLQSFMPPALY